MDGWMDGWMDGRMDGRTDGRTDRYVQGSKLGGLNSPAAPSNFCREPKDVLVSIHNTFR